ncbi:hypothetical protein [Acinetobacter puyangensis]|uniref:hypothetical protein n=1 Tax=Acinetobacter puyangensis TaxID=1096779 RepID=UPI003A4D4791
MSTTSTYSDEEIQGWIQSTKESNLLIVFGTEGEDAYGIGPYFSCYILHDEGDVL